MTGAPLRDATGKFKPGISGNPGGRPAAVREVAEAARHHTKTAIDVLAAIAADSRAPANARVSAAATLLDRAWGRAPQSLEVSRGPDHGGDLSQLSDHDLISLAVAAGVKGRLVGGTDDDDWGAPLATLPPAGDG